MGKAGTTVARSNGRDGGLRQRHPQPRWRGAALIVALAFYEPLTLWADNIGHISSVIDILLIGVGVALAGIGVLILIGPTTGYGAASIAVAILIACLFQWDRWNEVVPGIGVLMPLLSGLVAYSLRSSRLLDHLILVAAISFGGAPLVELVGASIAHEEPPLAAPEVDISAEGVRPGVDDMILVVLDGMPSPLMSVNLHGHDLEPLALSLRESGFITPAQTWSTSTATAGSIPSLLTLGLLEMSGVPPSPRNFQRIAGGDNLVAKTLQAAGFRYVHIQPGWFGSLCGEWVDSCVSPTSWSPASWRLLEPSIGGARLRNTYGSVFAHGGLEVVAALEAVMREVVADGSNDFVFAHVPLPHPPLVLGPECGVVPERASDQREYGYHPTEDRASWRLALGEQLSCTELLIERLAETVDESTAIVMTSDHGTESMGQMIKPAESWSDNDLAERLSAFTTYRFPQICKKPDGDVNVVYVRGLLECALAVELDLDSPLFHLMTHSRDADVLPVSRVSDARMASIRDGYQVSSTRETVHASG